MRIAIASPELGTGGGVPHYCRELALALSEEHEVHVFASVIQEEGLSRVQCHRLPALRAGWCIWHACFYLMARLRFAWLRLFARQSFDLVIGVGGLTPFADVATAHFVHAGDVEQQRRYGYSPERSFTRLERLDFAVYSHLLSWLECRYYRRAHARVIAISESVARDLERWECLPLDTAVVVPNGVNIERFHPRNRERYRTDVRTELGIAEHEFVALFVGNAWGRKGLRAAIAAIGMDHHEETRLVVVGEGVPDTFVAGLSAELAVRIVFAGPRARDIERYYAAADVFLMPTLYEPFGLVILEALASGLPTIVSQRAGASEWLTDGVHAILLRDPANPEEVHAALASVMGDERFAADLSANGRGLATRFTWEHVAAQLLAAAAVPAAVSPLPAR